MGKGPYIGNYIWYMMDSKLTWKIIIKCHLCSVGKKTPFFEKSAMISILKFIMKDPRLCEYAIVTHFSLILKDSRLCEYAIMRLFQNFNS